MAKSHLSYLLPMALSLFALSACSNDTLYGSDYTVCPEQSILTDPLPQPQSPSAPLSHIGQEVINGTNRFALDFYLASSKATEENIFLSPFSVGNVLGMLANGDDGESRDEILSLLGFEQNEEGLAKLNEYHSIFLSNLPNLDDTSCLFTNSVWHDYYIPLYRNFLLAIDRSYYAADINLSPKGHNGREFINQFVKTNTMGLIENFLDKPIDASVAFLNTAYFKGKWKTPFDKSFTADDLFLNQDYSESMVPFMNTDIECDYAMAQDGTEAIRLPYGKDGSHFSMILILPSDQINHVPLDEALDNDNLKQLNDGFSKRSMTVSLPKFDVTYKNDDTMDILKEMGIQKTCDSRVGFPLIVDYKDPFYLDCFIHAGRIIVDEEGTEGASSSIGGGNGVESIVFNRPFCFMIQENSTGAILFIGSVRKL